MIKLISYKGTNGVKFSIIDLSLLCNVVGKYFQNNSYARLAGIDTLTIFGNIIEMGKEIFIEWTKNSS